MFQAKINIYNLLQCTTSGIIKVDVMFILPIVSDLCSLVVRYRYLIGNNRLK